MVDERDKQNRGVISFGVWTRVQCTTVRPLDGDVLSHGRARAPARGPTVAPLSSLSSCHGERLLSVAVVLVKESGRKKVVMC
jgi:hypothetical protein